MKVIWNDYKILCEEAKTLRDTHPKGAGFAWVLALGYIIGICAVYFKIGKESCY